MTLQSDKQNDKRGPRGTPMLPPDMTPDDPLLSELITYVPGDSGPAKVRFAGFTFQAHVPQRVEAKASWIDMVRGNKSFVVGEFDPAKLDKIVAPAPKTDKQYRAHCIAWLNRAQSVRDIIRLWVRDTQLRHECEVGSDDFDWLGSLIEPRLAELAKIDGLTEKQVAGLWVEHGVFQKPWVGVNAMEVKEFGG